MHACVLVVMRVSAQSSYRRLQMWLGKREKESASERYAHPPCIVVHATYEKNIWNLKRFQRTFPVYWLFSRVLSCCCSRSFSLSIPNSNGVFQKAVHTRVITAPGITGIPCDILNSTKPVQCALNRAHDDSKVALRISMPELTHCHHCCFVKFFWYATYEHSCAVANQTITKTHAVYSVNIRLPNKTVAFVSSASNFKRARLHKLSLWTSDKYSV